MYPMAEFLTEKRLRWFGHARRRDKDEATRTILYRWKTKSRQTKAEMARPGERGYGQKPDDDWDGGRQKTLACHDPSRDTIRSVEADKRNDERVAVQ